MPRVRSRTIAALHNAHGRAAEVWSTPELSDSLKRYGFRHGVAHLLAADQTERAARLLTDFPYTMARFRSENGPGAQQLVRDATSTLARTAETTPLPIASWEAFHRERAHLLRRGTSAWGADKILLQLAVEHADDSPVTQAAERWLEEGHCDWLWLRQIERPTTVEQTGILVTLETSMGGGYLLGGSRLLQQHATPPTLEIWDTQTCIPIHTVEASKEVEVRRSLLLGSSRLLTGWKTLWLWDLEDLTSEPQVIGNHDSIICGWTAVDEDRVFTWSEQTAKLWSLSEARCLMSTTTGESELLGATLLSDGRIVTWDWNGLGIWEAGDDEASVTEEPDDYVVGGLQTASGVLAVWTDEYQILLFDVDGLEALGTLEGHEGFIGGMKELSDDRLLSWAGDPGNYPELTGPYDGSVRVWSVKEQCELLCIDTGLGALKQVCVLDENKVVVLNAGSTVVQLWSLSDGTLLGTLSGMRAGVGSFHIAHGQVACFSGGGTVQIWPLSAFGDTAEAQERSWIGGHALDEGTLAFVQNDAAWLWDPVECRVIGPFGGDKTQDPQAWPDVLDRLPGGTMLACSRGRVIKNDGRHGRLWFVNSRDGQPQQALTDDSDAYKVVGDQYLLIDRRSQPSEVWALSPPALKRRLEGGTAGVMGGRSLTWSLRCQALKLLSQDNTVVLEEAENLSKGWSEPWISNCRPLPDNRFTAWGRQAVQIRNSDGCLIREEAIPGHVKIWLPNDTLLYIVEEVIYHWDTRHDPVPLEGYRARWAAGQALSHLFMASRNLLLGRSGGQVGLWSLQTGACVHRFPVPADSQFTALDHPDVVVTWERESTAGLRFWQFGEDAPQASTTEFTAPITAVVALGNGRCLTLEQGGHTTIWSADGALIEALELGKDTVVKIEPYGGGAYFVSHQRVVKTQSGWTEYTNCRVRIWEPGGPVREYLGHSAKVLGLLPVNTHTALSWDDGGVLHSFDPHTMERKASAPNHDRSTPTLLVDGRVFTGFNDRENLGWRHTKVFALWDPETGTSERVVEARGACHLETGAVAFWTESDLVRVFDDTLEPAYELRGVLGYQPLGDGEMVAEIVGASSPQMVVCRADGFETFEGECRGLYRVNALDSDTI